MTKEWSKQNSQFLNFGHQQATDHGVFLKSSVFAAVSPLCLLSCWFVSLSFQWADLLSSSLSHCFGNVPLFEGFEWRFGPSSLTPFAVRGSLDLLRSSYNNLELVSVYLLYTLVCLAQPSLIYYVGLISTAVFHLQN
jgi:hypothetical protein